MSEARRALATTAIVVCGIVSACGGSSSPATGPTPARGFAGQWSGTTGQGQAISFTVSPDEKLTSINVGYSFNGCSGTQAYSNLALDITPQIVCIPGPCPPDVSSYRSLAYDTGDPFQGPSTSIRGFLGERLGTFVSEGQVNFRSYPGCGTAQTAWTASRR